MAQWDETGSICDRVASWKKLNAKIKEKCIFFAWCIWMERNQKVFENKTTLHDMIIARVH